MKILAIRGYNLASLEGEFIIDFTIDPLFSAGIFAISGPTGAGKSTILDAMCLALFAKTPRTDQARENNVKVKDVNDDTLMQGDPRFLLRRGTVSGYAETDFLALNGQRYRSRWSIARAREKENGRLQNYRMFLYNLDTGKEEQGSRVEIQNRIVELIGLTYEQFTRSVLLAQNDFATFLKAEQGEKAALLEKLTGTERYSAISRLIFEKNSEAKEAYEKIKIQIESIELLSGENESEIYVQLEETDKLLQHLEKLRNERQLLLDAMKADQQTIITKQKQQQEANDKLVKAKELAEMSIKSYEEIKIKYQQLELAYKELQPQIKEARKLDIQLENDRKSLREADDSFKKAKDEQIKNETKIKQLVDKRQTTEKEISRLMGWLETYRSKEKIAEQLSVLLIHLDHAVEALKIKEKAENNRQKLKSQIDILFAKISQLELSKDLTDEAAINKAIDDIRRKREKLIIEQTRFATSGDVKALRDKLIAGTPCPVCGSIEHPYASAQVIEYFIKVGNEIITLENKIAQLNQLVVLITEKKKHLELLPHEENEIIKQQEILDKTLATANELFGNDTWQMNWKQNAVSFRNKLLTFAEEWKQNKEFLEQLKNGQTALELECKSYESFSGALREQVEKAQILYQEKLMTLENRQVERSYLLKGKPADTIENEITQQIESIKKHSDELFRIQTEQSRVAEQYKGIVEQISADLSKTSSEFTKHQKMLQEWTIAYNNSTKEEKPLDGFLSQTAQQKSEYTFLLRKQEENRQKVTILQNELDTKRILSEQWGRLNELAGSADGAKFRRIAQGYTLDILLDYANVQLHNLTPRYYLERVPATLALQVIDHDMCDEIRTVHSLSGGESFLVSLALALGLSSLSSNRMKVESLFIDEGFGSLDTDTLRIALDALENLRTQGRKIGVISHVQEMTERISIQIKVNSIGNGKSYIGL